MVDLCCAAKCELHQYRYGLCFTHYQINRSLINREELFDILGRNCISCNISDTEVLQFDHINNDGNLDSKRGNILWYVNHPDIAKKTLQVLCANCHIKKHKKIKQSHSDKDIWKL